MGAAEAAAVTGEAAAVAEAATATGGVNAVQASAIMRFFFTGGQLANTAENVAALQWYRQIALAVLARYAEMGYTGSGVATQTARLQQIADQLSQWGIP